MDFAFRLLGRLEATRCGRRVPLSGTKQRHLLAYLLLQADQTVQPGRLLDELWSGASPRSASANLRTYIAELRSVLTPPHASASRLVTRHPGYLLHVEPAECDLHLLELARAAAGKARMAGDRWAQLAALDRAVRLWRGPTLEDLRVGPTVSGRSVALDELRLGLVEERAEVRLELGDLVDAIAELGVEIADHPLRERLHALLIRAQYRSGDVAGALRTCERAFQLIRTELGVEPGAELTRLHQAVLARDEAALDRLGPAGRHDPAEAKRLTTTATIHAGSERHELPPVPVPLVGRGAEVGAVVSALRARGKSVRIAAVFGAPGTGKSAVALAAARQVAAGFADGRWYVDLHGNVGLVYPDPLRVLARLLRSCGIPAGDLPDDADEAACLLRSCLSGRRVLLVVDNATDVAQVRALVPPDSGSAVLVTSRPMLTTLDGARHVEVGPLPADDSVRLLSALAPQCAGDTERTRLLARLCAYVPMALRAAGARLASRPSWPVAHLVRVLGVPDRRLAELEWADLSVRDRLAASFAWLAEGRPEGWIDGRPHRQAEGRGQAAALLRAAGAADVTDVSVGFAARVLRVDAPRAGYVMDLLVDQQLAEPLGTDRVRLLDLVRLFARELARPPEPP